MRLHIFMSKYKWTDEQLIEAVKTSISIRETLIKLNLVPTGQNYKVVPKRIKELQLDNSHFLGKGHLKNKTHNYVAPKPLEEILVQNSTYTGSNNLKRRLINEGLLTYFCFGCGINKWDSKICEVGEKTLSLHLDHINGINDDNRLENLRLLCPNCHSLTGTYAGKNIKREATATKLKRTSKKDFCVCGKNKNITSISCRTCSPPPIRGKIHWPQSVTLLKMIDEFGIKHTAEKLDCTESSVRKRILDLKTQKINNCECGKEKFINAKMCRSCYGKIQPTKIVWPSLEDLVRMVKKSSFLSVGKNLGVSDNAVRKRLTSQGINLQSLKEDK